MKKTMVAAGLLISSASIASAQWINQKNGGEFDDDPTYLALTASGRYGLGFRCNSNELKIILITPEKVDDSDNISLLEKAGPKLRIKIDGGAIKDFDADLDEANGTLGIIADADVTLVKSVRNAKSKISAVLSVLGMNFHETTFNVRGSKTAINKLIDGCKLNERADP